MYIYSNCCLDFGARLIQRYCPLRWDQNEVLQAELSCNWISLSVMRPQSRIYTRLLNPRGLMMTHVTDKEIQLQLNSACNTLIRYNSDLHCKQLTGSWQLTANNYNYNDIDGSLLSNPRSSCGLKPVLNWANVCSPNILRTLRRTMIRFLIELLVRRTWFGRSKLYFVLNWLVMRCKLRPELATDAQQTAWSKI